MVNDKDLPPGFLHHETVKSRLRKKVEDEDLTEDEAEEIYDKWLEKGNNKK